MDDVELCYLGAAAQAELIRSGEVSASEVVDVTIDRIDNLNPTLNCYREVFADQAREQAAEIDASAEPRGVLAGVPVAVKDSIAVAGSATPWGTSDTSQLETEDSGVVAALRQAGAIIIGKTTCSELAVWPFTEPPATGPTRNPWNHDYSPGGSSGGSAVAAAAGLCGLAVGSDGLGSIRVPAGFSGIFGLKPQRGRVAHGTRNWHGLSVIGPLARTVRDAAVFLDAAAISNPPSSYGDALEPGQRLSIGLAYKSAAYWPVAAKLEDQRREAVEATAGLLREMGHRVTATEVDYPPTFSSGYLTRYLKGIEQSVDALDDPSVTRMMATFGRKLPARALDWALADEKKSTPKILKTFDDFEVLLTPGPVQAPLRIGELAGKGAVQTLFRSGRKIPHFAPWNTTGQPAVSVPVGFDEAGLPMAVQLVGRPDGEQTLLRLAAEIEQAQPWADRLPV